MEGNLQMGNPLKFALLMEKRMLEVSLILCQDVVAVCCSCNSSCSLSWYQDSGDCWGNPSIPCHLLNTLVATGYIL